MKNKNLTIAADASCAPLRHPCKGWSCEGGVDTDHGGRPFKHASTGRNNWKRNVRKRQRRVWSAIPLT